MLSPTSTFILIPAIAVFAVLYLIIAIVMDRRRARLARTQEAERDAKREREWHERDAERDALHTRAPRRNAGSQSPTLLHRMGQPNVAPTSQDIAWLNTWLTEEYPTTE
jgi:flagellar biosynthesis/type III secretory pathway M-ring protein FliF/YscJ